MAISLKSNSDGISGTIQVNGVDTLTVNSSGETTLKKLNVMNTAGTVTNLVVNTATAPRTWTLPDKDGTVAMTSDVASISTAGSTIFLATTFGGF